MHGLDVLEQELGDLVVEAQLPRLAVSQRAGPTRARDMSMLRHPDTGVVESALRRVVEVARVEMGEPA